MRGSGKLRGRSSFGIVALLLLSAVLIPIAQNLPSTLAHNPNVPTLSAFGTATVDGVISPGEYGSCIGPTQLGPSTFRFCETNDAVNDYYAFEINQVTNGATDALYIFFDNKHDGSVSSCGAGPQEDYIAVFGGAPGAFEDGHYCYSPPNLLPAYSDIPSGVANGVGIRKSGGLGSIYELSHPLKSGDLYDYSLNFGDTVGFCLYYPKAAGPNGGQFALPNDCHYNAGTTGSAAKYGDIVKVAPPFPPISIGTLTLHNHSLTTFTDTNTTTTATSVTSTGLTTESTTTTQLQTFGTTSTVTSASASTFTNTLIGDALTSTTTTATGVQPVTLTSITTVVSTTTSCITGAINNCTTVTFTNETTSTIVTKSTETVTLTEFIRTPITFTNTQTLMTVVTSTFISTGQYTTTITTTYTSPVLVSQTSTSTATYTTTITTIDTEHSGGGGPPIPGFPIEAILTGIILGAAILAMFRRRLQ